MTTPPHYNQFPPEFEPYKICNNANFNGNLQQIFQYVARRKHKGNEIADLEKALDFVRFEKEREKDAYFTKGVKVSTEEGFHIHAPKLHTDFIQYTLKEDPFLGLIYNALTCSSELVLKTDIITALLTLEITRLKKTNK